MLDPQHGLGGAAAVAPLAGTMVGARRACLGGAIISNLELSLDKVFPFNGARTKLQILCGNPAYCSMKPLLSLSHAGSRGSS